MFVFFGEKVIVDLVDKGCEGVWFRVYGEWIGFLVVRFLVLILKRIEVVIGWR